MNNIFHDKLKDNTDSELKEIIENREKYQEEAVIAAQKILESRNISIETDKNAAENENIYYAKKLKAFGYQVVRFDDDELHISRKTSREHFLAIGVLLLIFSVVSFFSSGGNFAAMPVFTVVVGAFFIFYYSKKSKPEGFSIVVNKNGLEFSQKTSDKSENFSLSANQIVNTEIIYESRDGGIAYTNKNNADVIDISVDLHTTENETIRLLTIYAKEEFMDSYTDIPDFFGKRIMQIIKS